jgi:hypothetical protein
MTKAKIWTNENAFILGIVVGMLFPLLIYLIATG